MPKSQSESSLFNVVCLISLPALRSFEYPDGKHKGGCLNLFFNDGGLIQFYFFSTVMVLETGEEKELMYGKVK